MARDTKATRMKKKERKNIAAGVAHVNSSFNNTKILISDVQGNAIAWSVNYSRTTSRADLKLAAILCHESQFERSRSPVDDISWVAERMRIADAASHKPHNTCCRT